MLYSKSFERRKVELFRDAHLAAAATLQGIDSWAEIQSAITKYKSIEKLVFLVHSNPGAFMFGPDAREELFKSEIKLADAAKQLESLPKKTQVGIIDLAGCNVGLDIDSVLKFGLSLDASTVISTNHFHELALVTLQGRPKRNAALRRDFPSLKGYVSTPGIEALVDHADEKAFDKTVLLEWYVADKSDTKLILPFGAGSDTKARADVFKKEGNAYNVTVTSQADLDALRQDMAQFEVRPFQQLIRITIKLEGFRGEAGVRSPAAQAVGRSDGGQPAASSNVRPDAGQGASPPRRDTGDVLNRAADRPDAGYPVRPAAGRPSGRGRALPADNPAVRAVPGGEPPRQPPRVLEAQNQAIVDEVFRRGGSVGDAMGILYARALDKVDPGNTAAQRWLQQPLPPGPVSRAAPRQFRPPRFTLEDRSLLEDRDPSDIQQRRADEVEALRPLVQGRFDAYVAGVKLEFDGLKSAEVRRSFEPIRTLPYIDSYATALEKYIAMRAAYYRAGWPCMKRDVFDQIVPATFFGTTVIGGVHRELAAVLRAVEDEIGKTNPQLANERAAGFVIGGFVPRFQAGSDQLSNHAYGLAIDIDATWNPQVKSAAARLAFARATGDDIGRSLYAASSLDGVEKTYQRVAAMSVRLQEWLNEWLPQYEQLVRLRTDAAKDPKGKEKVVSIDNQIRSDPDLSALATLISEYTRDTVLAWKAYGIVTIPSAVIKAFIAAGRQNGARWGGQYDNTKDIMHLELLRLAGKDSLARPGGPGRRPPVAGFDDLRRGTPPREPDCKPAPPKVPVVPQR